MNLDVHRRLLLLFGVLAGCHTPSSDEAYQAATCGSGYGSGDCLPYDADVDAPEILIDAGPDSNIDAPICTIDPPPLPALPNFNRRFEFKGDDQIPASKDVAEIKLGLEIRSKGESGGPGMQCESASSASLLGYLFIKILGQEAGVSMSGNGSQHLCKSRICENPPQATCGGQQCETATVGGAVAVYRGVEWKLCSKLKKLGWIGAQICKFVDAKAQVRIGLGATASISSTQGRPTGSCETCCSNGRSLHSITAGPSGLLEGKAAVTFKLWRLEIEAGIGAKGCASVTGTIGNTCEGGVTAKPKVNTYAAVCVESMVAPGINFRILNNNARVCIPLGFWEKCFDIERCWKTDSDPALACPSGSPNPE